MSVGKCPVQVFLPQVGQSAGSDPERQQEGSLELARGHFSSRLASSLEYDVIDYENFEVQTLHSLTSSYF